MDFDLSDDQLAISEVVEALLSGTGGVSRVRRLDPTGDGIDSELWGSVIGQGWLGIEESEERGGLGGGAVDSAVIAEKVGAYLSPVPWLESVLALDALDKTEASASSRVVEWRQGLASGAFTACVDVGAVAPRLATDDRRTLSGLSGPVPWAPSASVAIVAATESGGGAGLYAVAPPGRIEREPAMDLSRPLGRLQLADAPAVRLGGVEALERVFDRGAALSSAEMLGSAQRLLDMTVGYATERQQFGRPIGSFQAVKHRCADMLVDVEGMRSVAYYAAWSVAVDDEERSVAASTAKIWCSDAALRVAESALQVHGGIGFTWESDVHLYLKRVHLTGLRFGSAADHRRRLVELLRPRVQAGHSIV